MGTQVLIISKNNGLNIGVNIAYITAICPGIGNDNVTSILFAIFYWCNCHSLHTIVGVVFGFEDAVIFPVSFKSLTVSPRPNNFASINLINPIGYIIIIFICYYHCYSNILLLFYLLNLNELWDFYLSNLISHSN